MKKKFQTTQRRMSIIQKWRKHGASVHDAAVAELHDPDSELKKATTEPNPQDPDEHEESSHDADNNPSFDEDPNDEPEDEVEPWVDHKVRATHKAVDLLAANGITSWILRQSGMHWKQAKNAGQSLSLTGIQRYQAGVKGTRSWEDRPRDGKTGSPRRKIPRNVN